MMATLVWNWPQLVWLGLAAMGLGVAIIRHGEPRKPYSMWDQIYSTAIAVAILYFGGFWSGAAP